MDDEAAIQQVQNLYSEASSRAAWDEVAATFVPEGTWSVPGMGASFAGREEICAGLVSFTAPFDYIAQYNSPAVIEVDGDYATARCMIRECGKYTSRNATLEVLGSYTDRLVRVAEGWRFVDRTFTIIGMHTFDLAASETAG